MRNESDIHCRRFAELLSAKKEHYPFSDRYRREILNSPDKRNFSERDYMVRWFTDDEIKGDGSYKLKTPNKSARRCYNSLLDASTLLWIAEAVGIDELTVRRAYEVAASARDNRRACGAIRKIITWDMIYTSV